MKPDTRKSRSGLLLAAVGLLSLCGCYQLSFIEPPPHQQMLTHSVSQPARQHVHIVMLDGFDPLEAGHLAGLRTYLNRLGFCHTFYGQCYDTPWFGREIFRAAHTDKATRFVVIVQNCAQLALPWILDQVPNVPIDMIVLVNTSAPPEGYFVLNEPQMTRILQLGNLKQPPTLDRLVYELTAVARSIPVVYAPPPHFKLPDPGRKPSPPGPEELPPPRPGAEEMPAPRRLTEELALPHALTARTPETTGDGPRSWEHALDPVQQLQTPPDVGLGQTVPVSTPFLGQ